MDLAAKIRTLPAEPGVYLYKNAEGEVIYVGKAKNLRSRVSSYFHEGRWEDSKTGTLELQATFPNPRHTLLPGQFGRIRVTTREQKNAILIPQRAVQELQGLQSVFTVEADNKVVARAIVTGDRVGERWIVLQGLKPGDRVIVEGVQKVRPGATVNPRLAPAPSPSKKASE